MSTPEFQPCLPLGDLAERTAIPVKVGETEIVLCRFDGEVYAIEDRCSHADQPLACGIIRNGWIACPAHGGRFDLATGEAVGPPASEPVRTFPVRIVGEMIEVAA